MQAHRPFLQRTLALAARGGSATAPNPMVGALLVHNDAIVAEGWHRQFGQAHAEVEALARVADEALLRHCTLYVSLEPCNHHGKTPPCTERIIACNIPRVVVGCVDPNPHVSGKGIERLRAAGIEVVVNDAPQPFIAQNRAFFVNQQLRRPYIILKWAQTADGKMGDAASRLHISGADALRWGHALRAQAQAILIGTRTALQDDPVLSTRHYPGPHPLRLVVDKDLKLPPTLRLFTDGRPTWVINAQRHAVQGNIAYWQPSAQAWADPALLLHELYHKGNIGSVLVEGGARMLQQFLDTDLYDELYVYKSHTAAPTADVLAPVLAPQRAPRVVLQSPHDALFASFVPRIADLQFLQL
jgi:diaminohydroxyphosphoribosylaminopyrimidine deaminase/5-amino-6-(5-phosphoribosylamino)uracil reductase